MAVLPVDDRVTDWAAVYAPPSGEAEGAAGGVVSIPVIAFERL